MGFSGHGIVGINDDVRQSGRTKPILECQNEQIN